jgi:hypothetical protein
MGPENATEKEWGVNYRALNDLFNISHDRRDTIKYELGVQMVEIYNEQIRDLLGTGGSQKKYPSYSRLVSVKLPLNEKIVMRVRGIRELLYTPNLYDNYICLR